MAAAILREFSNKYEEISPIVRTLDILIQQHDEAKRTRRHKKSRNYKHLKR